MQLAARESGLENVGRVHRAFGAAGADERVDFVDEEDHVAAAARLVEHRLDALLELAAVFGARDHEREVERDDAAAEQQVGDGAGGDRLREPFDDGRLADARLADQRGVVLVAAREDLHEPLDFLLAPDHRVEFLLGGEAREVAPEGVQRGRGDLAARRRAGGAAARGRRRGAGTGGGAGMGRRVELLELGQVRLVVVFHGHAAGAVRIGARAALAEAAAGAFPFVVVLLLVLARERIAVEGGADRLQRFLVVDAEVGQRLGGAPLPFPQEREQEVLGADDARAHGAGFGNGDLEDLLETRRVGQRADLLGVRAGGRGVFFDGEAGAVRREGEAAGDFAHAAFRKAREPEQQMLGADRLLTVAVGFAVRDLDRLLGVGGKEIEGVHGGKALRPREGRRAVGAERMAGR